MYTSCSGTIVSYGRPEGVMRKPSDTPSLTRMEMLPEVPWLMPVVFICRAVAMSSSRSSWWE